MSFLETPRFPESLRIGTQGGPVFSTQIVETKSGYEYRNVNWSRPRYKYNAAKGAQTWAQIQEIIDFFNAVKGQAYGFRYKDPIDYKSCAYSASLANTDQALGDGDGTTTEFQLIKTYSQGALSTTRAIKKPVDGTTVIAVDSVSQTSRWSVDTTTGIVTFSANIQKTITAATSASPCVLTAAGHGLTTGDTVYLSTFTGDWAALNGTRYVITKLTTDTFSINVDTSGYTAYSSNGGQLDTLPQTGETVTAGYEFDVPVRFGVDDLSFISLDEPDIASLDVPLVEIKPI